MEIIISRWVLRWVRSLRMCVCCCVLRMKNKITTFWCISYDTRADSSKWKYKNQEASVALIISCHAQKDGSPWERSTTVHLGIPPPRLSHQCAVFRCVVEGTLRRKGYHRVVDTSVAEKLLTVVPLPSPKKCDVMHIYVSLRCYLPQLVISVLLHTP